MDQQGQPTALQMIGSLNSWWQLAGVDAAVGDDAVDWLKLDEKPETIPVAPLPKTEQVNLPIETQTEWPNDIEILRAMMADNAGLPGNAFSNRPVVSVGPANASFMVISDFPDADEVGSGVLGSGATGNLLARMLAAIDVKLSDCYWTTLSATVPATGELPDAMLTELADFVRHQMAMVEPARIVVLGSSASRALLGIEMINARRNLSDFNYNGIKVVVLTTFHPRTLIARPQMKAQAWKDLQMFAKGDVL